MKTGTKTEAKDVLRIARRPQVKGMEKGNAMTAPWAGGFEGLGGGAECQGRELALWKSTGL